MAEVCEYYENLDQPNNIRCRIEINRLVDRFRDIKNDTDASEALNKLQAIVNNSMPLIQTTRAICSVMAGALEHLAEEMSEAIDSTAVRLEREENVDDKAKKKVVRKHRFMLYKPSEKQSPLEKLHESSKKLAELIQSAFAVAANVKISADAMTNITNDISSNVGAAVNKTDRLYETTTSLVAEAKALIANVNLGLTEAKDGQQLANDQIKKYSMYEQEHIAPLRTTVTTSSVKLGKNVKKIQTLSEELSAKIKQVNHLLEHDEAHCQKIVLRKKSRDLSVSVDNTNLALNTMVQNLGGLKNSLTKLGQATLECDRSNVQHALSSANASHNSNVEILEMAKAIMNDVDLATQETRRHHQDITPMVETLQSKSERVEQCISVLNSSDEVLVKSIRLAQKTFEQNKKTVAHCDNLSQLTRNCQEHAETLKAQAGDIDTYLEKTVIADPNRAIFNEISLNFSEIKSELLRISDSIDTEASSILKSSGDWKSKELEESAEAALCVVKKASIQLNGIKSIKCGMKQIVANTVIQSMKQANSEAIQLVRQCEEAKNKMYDVDCRNGNTFGKLLLYNRIQHIRLPNKEYPRCVLRIPGKDAERFQNCIEDHEPKRDELYHTLHTENERLVSKLVGIRCSSGSSVEQLTLFGLLGIRYVCNWNNDLGEIIVKEFNELTKRWSILPICSSSRQYDILPGKMFAEIRLGQINPMSVYAVVHRNREASLTVDEEGGIINLPGIGTIKVSFPVDTLSERTKVHASTIFPDTNNTPELLQKAMSIFLRMTFSPRPKKQLKFNLKLPRPPITKEFNKGEATTLHLMEKVDNSMWKVIASLSEEDAYSLEPVNFKVDQCSLFRQVDYSCVRTPVSDDEDKLETELRKEEVKRRANMSKGDRIVEECLSEPALRKLAAQIGMEFKKLACFLMITQEKMAKIILDNPNDTEEQIFQILLFWNRNNADMTPGQKVADLQKQLDKCGRKDLAQWLMANYKGSCV
ncbi:uncharacterized protein LOC144352344, partial [Saccoglossus kowalevskii]